VLPKIVLWSIAYKSKQSFPGPEISFLSVFTIRMIIAAEDEFRYLEEVQHRAKKRRIAFGLDDQLEPVRLDRRETASVVYEPTADEHVDLTPLQRKKSIAYGPAYLAGEETLRPNLAQEYVNDNRRRPQNALLNCDLKDRFNE